MSIIPFETYSNRLDILTAGYRTIRLDRIYKDNVPSFDSQGTNRVVIPKLNQVKSELKSKTKKLFKCTHGNEINSLCVNKENINHFISADEFKIYLWDINCEGRDLYNPVNIEPENETDNVERITKATYTQFNPHIFLMVQIEEISDYVILEQAQNKAVSKRISVMTKTIYQIQ